MIAQDIRIIFNKKITPDTFLMGLRSPEIAADAKPGQFVMVRVTRGVDPLLRRPFSICGVLNGDLFLILYRVVGYGTSLMAEKKEGEKLSILGPLGRGFGLPGSDQIPVLVAGGIGIAPLFFLAQRLESRETQFMMGFGSSEEIISLEDIIADHIDISIATDNGTHGHAGVVTDLLHRYLTQHHAQKGAITVFACGPLPMIKRVAALTFEQNIACRVSLETSMACGLGACQGCVVEGTAGEGRHYHHVCKDGPVFSVEDIDWESI